MMNDAQLQLEADAMRRAMGLIPQATAQPVMRRKAKPVAATNYKLKVIMTGRKAGHPLSQYFVHQANTLSHFEAELDARKAARMAGFYDLVVINIEVPA